MHNSSNIDVIVIGSPFKFMGGGQRRVHEVIRYYPSITAKNNIIYTIFASSGCKSIVATL